MEDEKNDSSKDNETSINDIEIDMNESECIQCEFQEYHNKYTNF